MIYKEDKIKNLFASKLKSFEVDVPTSVWEGIDRQLSAQTALIDKPKRHTIGKRVALTATLVAVAAMLALVFVVLPTDGIKEDTTVSDSKPINAVEPTQADNVAPDTKQKSQTKVASLAAIADKKQLAQNTTRNITKPSTQQPEVIEATMAKAFASPKAEQLAQPENKDNAAIAEDANDILTPSKRNREKELPANLPYKGPQNTETHIIRKGTKTASNFGLNVKGNMGLMASNISSNGNSDLLLSKELRTTQFISVMEEVDSKVNLKHSQPISVGILLSKQLFPRLSLETGIVYTHLSSKTSVSDLVNMKESQKFDYLGIPVNLSYTLCTWGKLNLYGTVGAMIQKDIQGTLKSQIAMDISTDNEIQGSEIRNAIAYGGFQETELIKKNIHQPNMQVSLHTTLGISYPIYKKLYLYSTIGGGYYIDADNKYETIYSDKRTQLDLNFGLKINL